MKYYCKHCGSTFNVLKGESSNLACALDNYMECPFCREYDNAKSYPMKAIPEFETVAQWEARKGQKYPETAPVYYASECIESDCDPSNCNEYCNLNWSIEVYGAAKDWLKGSYGYVPDNPMILVASEAGLPPYDWRPE